MWFIAGDNSSDFNYYTKRAILAKIYSATILYWIKNENLKAVSAFIDKQLKKILIIPKIKRKILHLSNLLPKVFSMLKEAKDFKL